MVSNSVVPQYDTAPLPYDPSLPCLEDSSDCLPPPLSISTSMQDLVKEPDRKFLSETCLSVKC